MLVCWLLERSGEAPLIPLDLWERTCKACPGEEGSGIKEDYTEFYVVFNVRVQKT